MNIKTLFLCFIIVLMAVLAPGCGSFYAVNPTAQDISRSQLAVQDAVIIASIQNPEYVPEMLKVSNSAVTGLNAGRITTLADVQALINEEATAMNFSYKTIAYANLFIANVTAIIQQSGQVSLKVPVQLCMVCAWVNQSLGGTAKCSQQLVTSATGT